MKKNTLLPDIYVIEFTVNEIKKLFASLKKKVVDLLFLYRMGFLPIQKILSRYFSLFLLGRSIEFSLLIPKENNDKEVVVDEFWWDYHPVTFFNDVKQTIPYFLGCRKNREIAHLVKNHLENLQKKNPDLVLPEEYELVEELDYPHEQFLQLLNDQLACEEEDFEDFYND